MAHSILPNLSGLKLSGPEDEIGAAQGNLPVVPPGTSERDYEDVYDEGLFGGPVLSAVAASVENNEVIDGAVSEISEYGAFVRIGPVEALLHKSQILDEPVQVHLGAQSKRIEGTQSGKHLEEGSPVRSRIVSKSIKQNDPRSSKIGLNCKMEGLGAFDWLGEEDD